MAKTDDDKFDALWISYSSLSDFLSCSRAYYLANVYKNPKSGKKISIINPALALGQSVHAVIDELSQLPVEQRFEKPLSERLEKTWEKISGKSGGFKSEQQEQEHKERAADMLSRIEKKPGLLKKKALKIKQDFPYYWFSEDQNMILCGKIDWMEYLEDDDSVHIVDFKTGRRTEKSDSLQLPIYYLIAQNCQTRPVSKVSYWYLDKDDEPQEQGLPDAEESAKKIMEVGKRMKLARQLNHFKCAIDEKNGCFACAPYEAILKGRGEFVGVGDFGREVYILPDEAVSL